MGFQTGIVPTLRGKGLIEASVEYEATTLVTGSGFLTAYAIDNDEDTILLSAAGYISVSGRLSAPSEILIIGHSSIHLEALNEINVPPFVFDAESTLTVSAGEEISSHVIIIGSGLISADIEYYKTPLVAIDCYDMHINRLTEVSSCDIIRCVPMIVAKEECIVDTLSTITVISLGNQGDTFYSTTESVTINRDGIYVSHLVQNQSTISKIDFSGNIQNSLVTDNTDFVDDPSSGRQTLFTVADDEHQYITLFSSY